MEVLSGMLADAAEAFNGKLYIHGGGWDTLAVRQFPAQHPTMSLVLLLGADASEAPGTGELRVQLVDDDGSEVGVGAVAALGIGQGPFQRPGRVTLVPVAFAFVGIIFEKPGGYEFRIFWNDLPLTTSVAFSVATAPPMPSFRPQQP